jgi:hypothetical protein
MIYRFDQETLQKAENELKKDPGCAETEQMIGRLYREIMRHAEEFKRIQSEDGYEVQRHPGNTTVC